MIAFSIWSVNIYWYWIFYLVWFLIWYFFLKFIGKSKIFKKFTNLQDLLSKDVDWLLVYIILWVLLWWRFWEVFIYQRSYFSNNLLEVFAVWNGWMSFIWWAIWVLISLFIMKRVKKLSNIEFFLLFDIILVVVPLAIMFGRFGNYLNQELFWLIVPHGYRWMNNFLVEMLTKLNIFHVYDLIDSNLRVNTNFISMFFEWIVLFFILSLIFIKNINKKHIKPWIVVGYFLLFYGLFRFFIEYLRVDSQFQYISLFTKSQWIFIVFIFVWAWFVFNKKITKISL